VESCRRIEYSCYSKHQRTVIKGRNPIINVFSIFFKETSSTNAYIMEVYLLQSKKISALEQRENFAGE